MCYRIEKIWVVERGEKGKITEEEFLEINGNKLDINFAWDESMVITYRLFYYYYEIVFFNLIN